MIKKDSNNTDENAEEIWIASKIYRNQKKLTLFNFELLKLLLSLT